MTSAVDLQIVQLFCEDFRMEETGQPMMLGLISPTVLVDPDSSACIDHLYTVTLVTAPDTVERLDLKLDLSILIGGEASTSSYAQTLTKDDDGITGPWTSIVPLKLPHRLCPGDEIVAHLQCNDRRVHSTVRLVPASGQQPVDRA